MTDLVQRIPPQKEDEPFPFPLSVVEATRVNAVLAIARWTANRFYSDTRMAAAVFMNILDCIDFGGRAWEGFTFDGPVAFQEPQADQPVPSSPDDPPSDMSPQIRQAVSRIFRQLADDLSKDSDSLASLAPKQSDQVPD